MEQNEGNFSRLLDVEMTVEGKSFETCCKRIYIDLPLRFLTLFCLQWGEMIYKEKILFFAHKINLKCFCAIIKLNVSGKCTDSAK